MTPEERSKEMAKRRGKSKKPAGGLHYVSKKRRQEIARMGGMAKKVNYQDII